MSTETKHPGQAALIFQFFKYTIYLLLCFNVYLFFKDDLSASTQLFSKGMKLTDIILAFSASIDTLAWIILLIVFELETYIISDEKLNGPVQWSMLAAKAICYFFIFYAFYGYSANLLFIFNNSPYQIADVCTLIGASYTYVASLGEYLAIDQNVCQLMNEQLLFQINGTEIITTEEALIDAQYLAWIDVINAFDWLLIVAILEVDVYLQLKDKFTGKARQISQIVKPFLYGILFICAIYWGINSDFVDFWDAFLWLLAFFFIEMNVFNWHAETESAKEQF